MRMYAAYNDDGIYGIGSTDDVALANARQYGATNLSVVPMTRYMAREVQTPYYHGFGLVRGVLVSERTHTRLSGQ